MMHSPEAPDISQFTSETLSVKRFVAEWFRLKLIDRVLYRVKPATGDRLEYRLGCGRILCVRLMWA